MKSSIAFIIAYAALIEAGTNKTLAPTPGVTRPPEPTEPPITPFPTEASTSIVTPESTPVRCFLYTLLIIRKRG